LISIFPYDGLLKKAIGKIKYHFVTDLVEEFIGLTLSYWPSFETKKAILIPIPLYWQRENWRGFNQAELLGRKIAKAFGWEVRTDILIRQKHTQPQIELKSEARQQNIRGAFKINTDDKLILNSKLVLFDDVWTTGSTLKEACKTLKKAGVKEVWGLTICR
jgi:ComF family protein